MEYIFIGIQAQMINIREYKNGLAYLEENFHLII